MSTSDGLSVEEGVRSMLLLMPRLVGRAKRLPVPESLRSLELAPRHLSLMSYLLMDDRLSINELAARLEVASTTVSLMVGELSRKGVLDRYEDDLDRRRTIVAIADAHRPAVEKWLAASASAWRAALKPLTDEQRAVLVQTLRAYEEAMSTE
jgi:DNA-binding MarR family transcriptional regulator